MHNPDASADAPATARSTGVPSTHPLPSLLSDEQYPAPPGYEMTGELGEGGMGIVYRARHVALDRPVALKYLRRRAARDPSASVRFLAEARITARLQHPGIPAVHEVGALPDGTPFLAMKLVQGRTLADLLGEQGPGEARWLATFEAVCQALAYAHSEGVIHRDLKPGNVMVGAFGEVQVMDWGLAKTLTGPRAASAEVVAIEPGIEEAPATLGPRGDSGTDETRHGSVIGTPAFMPPEQAVGAIGKLDRRSDVFGLGAILCALLTGKPPFVAPDAESTRQLAARADLGDAFARIDASDAGPELVALAKRCLSAEPDARPADAGALALDVARLRREADERARHAELDRARAEVLSDAMRRRRSLMLAGGGALLLVLLAGLGGTTAATFSARKARADEAEQRGVAETKRAEAEQARREAEADRANAEKARDLAKGRYRLAASAFHDVVFSIQGKLQDRPGTQELRKELLGGARAGLRKLVEAERQLEADHALVAAHVQTGDVELILGDTAAALAEFRTGHDLAVKLAAAHPDDATARRALGIGTSKMGDVLMRLGKAADAKGYYEKSLDVNLAHAKADPKSAEARRDVGISHAKLGDVCLELGQSQTAMSHYHKSLEIDLARQRDFADDDSIRRDVAASLLRLGAASVRLGKAREALGHFTKSLQIRQTTALANPKDALAQRALFVNYVNLGDVCLRLNQTDEALTHFNKSLEIALALAEADPNSAMARRDLAMGYSNLGSVYLRLGKTQEALTHQRKSLEIDLASAKLDPDSADARRDLAMSYMKVGETLLQRGEADEALESFAKSLALRLALSKADPKSAAARRSVYLSYVSLGDACLRQGRKKEALAHFSKSLEVALALSEADPKSAEARRDLSIGYDRVGDLCLDLGKPQEALGHFAKALDVRLALAKADPKNPAARRDLLVSYANLGDACLSLNKPDEALGHFTKILDAALALAKIDPKSAEARRDLSVSHNKMGDAFLSLGKIDEARDHYARSVAPAVALAEADPNDARAQTDLFLSYWKLGGTEKRRHDYASAGACFAKGRAVLLPLHKKKLLAGGFQNAIADMDRQIALCKAAERSVVSIKFVLAQNPVNVPLLFDLRVKALLHRKQTSEATKTADCWAAWFATQSKSRPADRYNAACALALCAATEASARDALVRKAAALLASLRDDGFFDDPKRLAHFRQDKDFTAVRTHPALVAFAKTLK